MARWLETLMEFDFQLEHWAHNRHHNADGLSRYFNCSNCSQCAHIENQNGRPTQKKLANCHL